MIIDFLKKKNKHNYFMYFSVSKADNLNLHFIRSCLEKWLGFKVKLIFKRAPHV